jgi:hypothetical protein
MDYTALTTMTLPASLLPTLAPVARVGSKSDVSAPVHLLRATEARIALQHPATLSGSSMAHG